MHRRVLLLLPLLSSPLAAQPADRLPPEAPDTGPRDDSRFSAELLGAMARGEALATERLGGRFAGLRILRRQVVARREGAVQTHYTTALAVERRWRNAGVTQPSSERMFLPPEGWTDGRHVLVLVVAHPSRHENGFLPFSILTNLRDG